MDNQNDYAQDSFDLEKMAAEAAQETSAAQKPRRIWPLIVGTAALIVLLGAAAFVGVRMGLLGPRLAGGLPGGLMVSPGMGSFAVQINMKPAPELPTAAPDLVGIYSRQDGSSLFINEITGSEQAITISGASSDSAQPANDSYSPPTGPEVEVVLTKDTKIYKEVTDFPKPDQGSGEQVMDIQQKVELVTSLDGLKAKTPLRVWGEKRGDRVIAQVVLYSEMMVSTN